MDMIGVVVRLLKNILVSQSYKKMDDMEMNLRGLLLPLKAMDHYAVP